MTSLAPRPTLLATVLWATSTTLYAAPQNALELEQLRHQLERQQQEIEQLKQEIFLENSDVFEEIAPASADSQIKGKSPNKASTATAKSPLSWSAYGVISYSRYDFFNNAQDTTPTRRAQTDLQRFILEPRYDFGNGIIFSGELEFEHGGVGAAVEYEPEEFGEFEVEVEKGGEVVVEQANLLFLKRPELNFRIGHFLVPVGMVNTWHRPADYFTVNRSPLESAMIPVVWHATGMEMLGKVGAWKYQLQVINSLDSSGFSGYGFVSGGLGGQQEHTNADDLAFVARVDYQLNSRLLFGGSVFHGDTADNRSRQNLDVDAYVTIAEAHTRFEHGPWTLRAQYMAGEIENSDDITSANINTYNAGALGISRTPVGKRAEGYFVEAGYDITRFVPNALDLKGRLDVFARIDDFDTMSAVEGNVVDNPRYQRSLSTVGLNYQPSDGIIFKMDLQRESNEGVNSTDAERLNLSLGFDF